MTKMNKIFLGLVAGLCSSAAPAQDSKASRPAEPRLVQLLAGGAPVRVEAPGYASPAWADVDGDGKPDLVVGQFHDGKLQVFKNLGKGKLAQGTWLQAGGKVAKIPGVWWCTSSTPQFVDLNGDGHVDMLSGSYSRMSNDMAGLFQVLWGDSKGNFQSPEVLKGTDGKPLIIQAAGKSDPDLDRICTRPSAVDLDGDGHLDIVSGNFGGTFAVFHGKGSGKFEPTNTWLMHAGKRLQSDAHSDPNFADWDGDGDLDMICGSDEGGVHLFRNTGTKKKPVFGRRETLLAGVERSGGLKFGADHVRGPQRSTRVAVADVDNDGKLDVLIGDTVDLSYPAQGLDEKTARTKLVAWNKESAKLNELMNASMQNGEEEMDEKLEKAFEAHWKKREKIVRSDSTGFVWVLYGR